MQGYISEELSHFVGRKLKGPDEQYALLLKILHEGCLGEPTPDVLFSQTIPAKVSKNEMFFSPCVCFCDIPFDDIDLHAAKYSPFGLSFLKSLVVERGGAPVFYVPVDGKVLIAYEPPGKTWQTIDQQRPADCRKSVNRGQLFDDMIGAHKGQMIEELKQRWLLSPPWRRALRSALREALRILDDSNRRALAGSVFPIDSDSRSRPDSLLDDRLDHHVFSYIKCFDSSLADDDPENYYFEREWRVLEALRFSLPDVRHVFLPQRYEARFRDDLPEYRGGLKYI